VTALGQATARLFVDPVLALVFPSSCPGCGGEVDRPTRGPLCAPCWTALPRHPGPPCACGFPLPAGVDAPCGRCRRGLGPFTRGASLGPYEGALRTLVHELKFRGRRRVAARLADRLLDAPGVATVLSAPATARPAASSAGPGACAPVLVPVPLHPRRLHERGFNQSALLAAAIGERRGLRVVADALVRREHTPPQTGLSAAQRRANVARAFIVRRRAPLAGRIVVLVDDVLTTGATARACGRALLQAGAAEVRLLTAARVA
jgi:ComF family protein